jgi:hypothetical protein
MIARDDPFDSPQSSRLPDGRSGRSGQSLAVWRCPACSRILAKLRLSAGSVIEIRCRSCGSYCLREQPESTNGAMMGALEHLRTPC